PARDLIGEIQTVSATIGRFGRWGVGEDIAMLAVYFAGGTLGWLDLSWCAAPDQSRPEWALYPTVAEGTDGTLRLLTDGSLEWISPRGTRQGRPVPLPPAAQVYVDGFAATQRPFIHGPTSGAEPQPRA